MSTGSDRSKSSGKDSSTTTNRNSRKSSKLSRSRLARGLRHAGLPLDRIVVDQLVSVFSTARRADSLSYADFHRMVHCKGLAEAGVAHSSVEMGRTKWGGAYAGGVGALDEQVRSAE